MSNALVMRLTRMWTGRPTPRFMATSRIRQAPSHPTRRARGHRLVQPPSGPVPRSARHQAAGLKCRDHAAPEARHLGELPVRTRRQDQRDVGCGCCGIGHYGNRHVDVSLLFLIAGPDVTALPALPGLALVAGDLLDSDLPRQEPTPIRRTGEVASLPG